MRFTLRDNLPFVTVTLAYRGTAITVPHVLIDTGSARTIFAFDVVSGIQIIPAPEDTLYAIRGVGGMDYGFDIQGILGMDFLRQSRAVLSLAELSLDFAS